MAVSDRRQDLAHEDPAKADVNGNGPQMFR